MAHRHFIYKSFSIIFFIRGTYKSSGGSGKSGKWFYFQLKAIIITNEYKIVFNKKYIE
jgi:hypothetical protein